MHSRRSSNRLYLITILLGAVLPLMGLIALGRTEWFLNHSAYPGLMIVGYGQSLKQENCKILIYGDSSALTGLDPKVIQGATGLTTCNIAEGTTVQRVIGTDLPLRNYLAHNTPPWIIVTSWTPTIFHPDQPPLQIFTIEGMWYAWTFGDWRDLFTQHGVHWSVAFVSWEIDTLWTALQAHLHGVVAPNHDYRSERHVRRGQWPYPSPPQTRCTRSYERPDVVRNDRTVTVFRRKYTTAETRVIVNITPVPECNKQFAYDRDHLAGLYDNTFERYPIQDFNDGDVHLNPPGAQRYSEATAAQILAMLHGDARDAKAPPRSE